MQSQSQVQLLSIVLVVKIERRWVYIVKQRSAAVEQSNACSAHGVCGSISDHHHLSVGLGNI